jgi:hypothetical protein
MGIGRTGAQEKSGGRIQGLGINAKLIRNGTHEGLLFWKTDHFTKENYSLKDPLWKGIFRNDVGKTDVPVGGSPGFAGLLRFLLANMPKLLF